MTLMMTSAQVVETSVNVTNNSPSRDYSHPADQTTQTTEVMNHMNSDWEEQVTIHMYQGTSRERAEAEKFHALLPAFRSRLRYVYLDHLKWFQDLKTDPIHRNVMKTTTKLMEEEDMDFEEAAEAAINKRKCLLNKIFEEKKALEEPSTVDVQDYYSRTRFPYNNGYSG